MSNSVMLKGSVGQVHCAEFIRRHMKMSNEDLAMELGCTLGYVKRIRRQQEKAIASKPTVEVPVGSQIQLNFAAKPKPPVNPINLSKVLLSMGYKRNTEEWYVAWMILKYGSVRGAQEGMRKVAERLHKIASTAEVLGCLAA